MGPSCCKVNEMPLLGYGRYFEALGLLHAHVLFPSDLHPQWNEMIFLLVLGIELRIYACWESAFPLSHIPQP